MTDTEADYREDADGFRNRRKPRSWSGLTGIVGTIAAFGAMLWAEGNGWSPLVFLALGLFGTPALAWALCLRGPARRWRMRGIAVLAVAILSFGLAKYSTRLDASEAFRQIFKFDPPAGVQCLRAKQQWYDGMDVVLSFSASNETMQAILSHEKYEDKSDLPLKIAEQGLFVPFLEMADLMPASLTQWHCWQKLNAEDGAGQYHPIEILWDEPTGRGAVVGGWH